MMGNQWATYGSSFATWQAGFRVGDPTLPERMLALARRVSAASEREQICRLLEIPGRYRVERDGLYVTHLERTLQRTGRLPLFATGSGAAQVDGERLRAVTRLAYFVEGAIVEGDVDDMGLLLRTLRPDATDPAHLKRVAPVTIWSTTVHADGSADLTVDGKLYVFVELPTDIWFPRIYGLLKPEDDDEKEHPGFENPLARLHTPRLNRYIDEVRRATVDLGGTWEVGDSEGAAGWYQPMVSERGII